MKYGDIEVPFALVVVYKLLEVIIKKLKQLMTNANVCVAELKGCVKERTLMQ